MKIDDYIKKTYAAWLGKNIGIRLGAPVEGWSREDILKTYGHINDYLVDYGIFAADDDANGPLFFVRSLERYGEDVSLDELASNMVGHISDGHGFFWWGGKGVSTEDTSYHNLTEGIKAPMSGSAEVNGQAIAEQIGGQIFSDCWGYVSYGNVERAVKLASKMSSVTHDLDGIEGGKFVAACIALAYTHDDIREVLEEALTYLDRNTTYVKCVNDVIRRSDEGESLETIMEAYGYHRYPGVCHILPNTAIMVWAMLKGNNDFSRTLTLLCECGWDTDCTCGNVGSIMGALKGVEGIDEKWIHPLKDTLLSSSLIGSLNIQSLSESALYFAKLGAKLEGVEFPEINPLSLPYATMGLASRYDRDCEIKTRNVEGHLRVIINNAQAGSEGRVFRKTYYVPEEVYDCRYQPSFTPLIHAGGTFRFELHSEDELTMQLYALKRNGEIEKGEIFTLCGDRKVSMTLKDKSALYTEVGICMPFDRRTFHQVFEIVSFDIDHEYDYEIDWTHEVNEDWGLDYGGVPFREVSQCTTLHNRCFVDEKGLHIEDDMVLFGDAEGKLKELEIDLGKCQGKMAVLFNVRHGTEYDAIVFDGPDIRLESHRGLYFTKSVNIGKLIGEISNNVLRITLKNGLILLDVESCVFNISCGIYEGGSGILADSAVVQGCKLTSVGFQ